MISFFLSLILKNVDNRISLVSLMLSRKPRFDSLSFRMEFVSYFDGTAVRNVRFRLMEMLEIFGIFIHDHIVAYRFVSLERLCGLCGVIVARA